MAKIANGKSYHPGNDNLNETQFTQGSMATPFSKGQAPKTSMKKPATETRTVTQQRPGEKGGHWKKKGRKRVI